MSYIADLELKQAPAALTPQDVAKVLWSASVRSIPFAYKNAKELTIGQGNRVTMVRVGVPAVEAVDSNYDGPVALLFAPLKGLVSFHIHFYNGIMLNGVPERIHRYISNAHGADNFFGAFQLDGYFYRVDYVADRNGAVPYNIEFNPSEESITTEAFHNLKIAIRESRSTP